MGKYWKSGGKRY